MTNVQLYLGLGVPILAIITSLIVSLVQVSGIREDMRQMRAEVRDDVRQMRAESRDDRFQIAADIKILTGKLFEIDTRLIRIEERMQQR